MARRRILYDGRHRSIEDDPMQVQILRCYRDLYLAVVVAAIYDYSTYTNGYAYDSAKSFLLHQENIDLAGLNMTCEDLITTLDRTSSEVIRNRITNMYTKKEEQ